jgi:hypothetical protein
MRITITPTLSKYLMDNNTVYPYSKLRPTRNSCYCKWIMLQGQDRGSKEYFPVLANSIPNGVLESLILSERGMPLSPDLTDIMDSMYGWGKTKNIEWYDAVIDMLNETLDNDIEEDRKELVRALISFEVKAEIHGYFAVDSVAAELLWINWVFWSNATYKLGPQSFIGMAKYSFEYVQWAVAQVNYHAPAPVVELVSSA